MARVPARIPTERRDGVKDVRDPLDPLCELRRWLVCADRQERPAATHDTTFLYRLEAKVD